MQTSFGISLGLHLNSNLSAQLYCFPYHLPVIIICINVILITATIHCFENFYDDISLLQRLIGRDVEINFKNVTFIYMFIGKKDINHLLIDYSFVDNHSVLRIQ